MVIPVNWNISPPRNATQRRAPSSRASRYVPSPASAKCTTKNVGQMRETGKIQSARKRTGW
jgi:hypothetical protein